MRRMQRQSIRKKGPMREGKSIRVASVSSSPLASPSLMGAARLGGSPPSAFHKMYSQPSPESLARVSYAAHR
jgi:hypothetical protein